MTGIFQKLFGHNRPPTPAPVTQPLPTETPVAAPPEQKSIRVEPPQLSAGCAQSVGRQRDHNEDSLLTMTTTLINESTSIPFGFYAVADGMGGHRHGEKASRVAVRVLAAHVVRKLYLPLLNLKQDSPGQSIQEVLQEGIQDAHRAIVREAPGGGTTLTAALVLGEQLTVAHVGDSRAYLLSRDGQLQVLTRDHSLVKRLEELGQITAEEAAVHPQRNVLYRALGQGEPVDADITTSPIAHAGRLLLCSDGMWGVVPEKDVLEILQSTPDPALACQKMVEAANAAGGPDNITAILVQMPD